MFARNEDPRYFTDFNRGPICLPGSVDRKTGTKKEEGKEFGGAQKLRAFEVN